MAYLFAVMNQLEPMSLHQFSELCCHEFGVTVSHRDRDKGSGRFVGLKVSHDALRNEMGVFIVVERVGRDDDLAGG